MAGWASEKIEGPPPKRAISIRMDEDVIAFFKEAGDGYQSRINAVLRHYMAAHTKKKEPVDG